MIELHADRAYAIALRMSGNPADAGDIAQEAFLRAARYIESYDPGLPFEAWLHRIIRNIYYDSLRREAARKSVPLSSDPDDDDSASLEALLPDPAPGPERLAQAAEDSQAVQAVLSTLSVPLRMAVVLVDLEGMSREDSARTLGCSLSALDVRLHRARALLRSRLGFLSDKPVSSGAKKQYEGRTLP